MCYGGNMQEKDCLFCRIINGEIPSTKIYEDDYVYAFLDIAPGQEGHTLVIPKKHSTNILSLDIEYGTKILEAIQKIAPAIMRAMEAEGFNIIQNNNEVAGQTVFHTHFHIIPRKPQDGMGLWSPNPYKTMEKMQETAKKIIDALQ